MRALVQRWRAKRDADAATFRAALHASFVIWKNSHSGGNCMKRERDQEVDSDSAAEEMKRRTDERHAKLRVEHRERAATDLAVKWYEQRPIDPMRFQVATFDGTIGGARKIALWLPHVRVRIDRGINLLTDECAELLVGSDIALPGDHILRYVGGTTTVMKPEEFLQYALEIPERIIRHDGKV